MNEIIPMRRELLFASLAPWLPMELLSSDAAAAPNPAMTIVKPPGELVWNKSPDYPDKSVERAALWGHTSEPSLYYTLIKAVIP